MDLQVIGAGFGRTGTLSLKLALEQLGFGPCYHMLEVIKRPGASEGWLAVAKGEQDWRPLLDGFRSVVDWPTTYFYRDFVAAYPKAKVILTERPAEEWFKSATSTIFPTVENGLKAAASADPIRRAQAEMANYVVFQKTFGGSLDKDNAMSVFKRHNEEVKRTIPKDRLLVYNSEEGWEPLCKFLGVSVPSTPYPKTNTTEEFRARAAQRAASSTS